MKASFVTSALTGLDFTLVLQNWWRVHTFACIFVCEQSERLQ